MQGWEFITSCLLVPTQLGLPALQGFTKETFPDWVSLLTFFVLTQPTSGREDAQSPNLQITWDGFFSEDL